MTFGSEKNIEGIVHFISSRNDINNFYSIADIVVSASTDPEAFGRISIEAQAMGKFVIASNHGGSTETIIDNETGLLAKPLDVNDLGKKIETALQFNKTQRKIINNNALKILKEKFSLDKMCNDTLNLYKNCIDKYN